MSLNLGDIFHLGSVTTYLTKCRASRKRPAFSALILQNPSFVTVFFRTFYCVEVTRCMKKVALLFGCFVEIV